MSAVLGCIADDYTGATDLGAMLSRAGMRVLLAFDLPAAPLDASAFDAVIIALKSRSIPREEAVTQSLAALETLRRLGAEQIFFKYCSTFDSTDEGNIGPVADALADALGATRVAFCPAFPENGRTVYCGNLFVNGAPLHESGMREHPLNPMTDSNLRRVLSRQSESAVGLLPFDAVNAGVEAAASELRSLTGSGARFIVTDALNDDHLRTIASVIGRDVLVTGGSAIGHSLAEAILSNHSEAGGPPAVTQWPEGHAAVIAGSCSPATQRQVAAMQASAPSLQVDPLRMAAGEQTVETIVGWASERLAEGPALIYSTGDATAVAAAHEALGRHAACELLEVAFGRIAAALVGRGVRRLVVAGGETSGAVMRELGLSTVRIGEEIAPGVPWILTRDEPRLAMALKSGNFGADSFFLDALRGAP